jgi:hypothetical protein
MVFIALIIRCNYGGRFLVICYITSAMETKYGYLN